MLCLLNSTGLVKIHTQICNSLSAKPSGYFLFLKSTVIAPHCLARRIPPEPTENNGTALKTSVKMERGSVWGALWAETETLPSKFPEVLPVKSDAAVHFSPRSVFRPPGPRGGGAACIYFSIFQYCSRRFFFLSGRGESAALGACDYEVECEVRLRLC